jgi:hypothetical protein
MYFSGADVRNEFCENRGNVLKIDILFIHIYCDLTFLFYFITEGCNLREFPHLFMCQSVYRFPLS